jgi:hypothetical protein
MNGRQTTIFPRASRFLGPGRRRGFARAGVSASDRPRTWVRGSDCPALSRHAGKVGRYARTADTAVAPGGKGFSHQGKSGTHVRGTWGTRARGAGGARFLGRPLAADSVGMTGCRVGQPGGRALLKSGGTPSHGRHGRGTRHRRGFAFPTAEATGHPGKTLLKSSGTWPSACARALVAPTGASGGRRGLFRRRLRSIRPAP